MKENPNMINKLWTIGEYALFPKSFNPMPGNFFPLPSLYSTHSCNGILKLQFQWKEIDPGSKEKGKTHKTWGRATHP